MSPEFVLFIWEKNRNGHHCLATQSQITIFIILQVLEPLLKYVTTPRKKKIRKKKKKKEGE